VSRLEPVSLALSGERFTATYAIAHEHDVARQVAQAICVEQTVEFPYELLPAGDIADGVVGCLEAFVADAGAAASQPCFHATISYAVETVGEEFTQLQNVLFGNVSLFPNVRLEGFDLPASLLANLGPRFGVAGVRAIVGAQRRPLLATALKPLGLSARSLSELAALFAGAGVDLIKDDHGLANQRFAPFAERVARCAAAVQEVNARTGGRAVYAPCVTGPAPELAARAQLARDAGAGALLIAPGVVGFDAMRALARDPALGLPVLAHPACLGGALQRPGGMAHAFLLGQWMRLAGADVSIFPHHGGRFSFSQEDCAAIARALGEHSGDMRPSLPAPAGGMTVERVPELLETYGSDVILLIGGGLFRAGPDLAETCRRLRDALGRYE